MKARAREADDEFRQSHGSSASGSRPRARALRVRRAATLPVRARTARLHPPVRGWTPDHGRQRRPDRAGIRARLPPARAATGSCGVAAPRRSRTRDGVHRQGRNRPEHPHVAVTGARRRAARPDRVGDARHGRYRKNAVRHGHVRLADDADDGAAAGAGGSNRARHAHCARRGAVARGCRVAPRRGRIRARGGRSLDHLRRSRQGRGAHRDDRRGRRDREARQLAPARLRGAQGRRPRLRDGPAPVSVRHGAAGDASRPSRAARRLRRGARERG